MDEATIGILSFLSLSNKDKLGMLDTVFSQASDQYFTKDDRLFLSIVKCDKFLGRVLHDHRLEPEFSALSDEDASFLVDITALLKLILHFKFIDGADTVWSMSETSISCFNRMWKLIQNLCIDWLVNRSEPLTPDIQAIFNDAYFD